MLLLCLNVHKFRAGVWFKEVNLAGAKTNLLSYLSVWKECSHLQFKGEEIGGRDRILGGRLDLVCICIGGNCACELE